MSESTLADDLRREREAHAETKAERDRFRAHLRDGCAKAESMLVKWRARGEAAGSRLAEAERVLREIAEGQHSEGARSPARASRAGGAP